MSDIHSREALGYAQTIDDALAEDARCRRVGVIEGIYTLDDIGHCEPLPHCLPTIRCLDETRSHLPGSDEAFAARIEDHFEDLATFDFLENRMVIAGGAVQTLLCTPATEPNDWDIFLYSHTEESAKRAIGALVRHLSEYPIDVFRTASCITLRVSSRTVQIILRLYNTKAEIIHGFDLGSCAMMWDGRSVLLTKLGVLAARHRINILNLPARRSTYEHRLCRYFMRGFSVVLPNMSTSAIDEYGHICLPYLSGMTGRMHLFGEPEGVECLCGIPTETLSHNPPEDTERDALGNRILVDGVNSSVYENDHGYAYDDLDELVRSNFVCIQRGKLGYLCTYRIFMPAEFEELDDSGIVNAIAEVNTIADSEIIARLLRNAIGYRDGYIKYSTIFAVLGETLGHRFLINLSGGRARLREVVEEYTDLCMSHLMEMIDNYTFPLTFRSSTDATALVSSDMTPEEWYGEHYAPRT